MSYVPRLKEKYRNEVVPALQKKFSYKSSMQVPLQITFRHMDTSDAVAARIRERAAEKVYSELGRLRVARDEAANHGRRMQIAVAGCVAQAEGGAGGHDAVVHVRRLLAGNVELVAQFAEISDAHAQHTGETDVDRACGAEREGIVREVGGG